MRKCDQCGDEQDDENFPPKGRGRSKTCAGCLAGPVQTSAKAKGKKAKRKKPKLTEAAAPPELALEFPAGYGFKAVTEDGAIKLTQSDADGNVDTVWLSRAEFATIVAHFGVWSGEIPA